jgi:hypothetical protein
MSGNQSGNPSNDSHDDSLEGNEALITTDFDRVGIAQLEHNCSLAVWDVRSPVECRAGFTIKVGSKCSASCSLAGQQIRVYDAQGLERGTARLSDTVFSPEIALFWAEVDLTAPDEPASYNWELRLHDSHMVSKLESESDDAGKPVIVRHFGFSTVDAAEHRVNIKVVGQDTQAGIDHVRVMLRPYSGFTDAQGQLELKVSGGEYKLTARVSRYEDYNEILTVKADIDCCIVLEPAEYYQDYRGNIIRVDKRNK